jgi:hypothetical protein
MQPVEIALFVVVAALAVALIAYAVRPHLKARQSEKRPDQPPELGQAGMDLRARGPALICPACHRDYAPGLRFCPHDARDLIPATDPIARAAGTGATCPTCKRSFDAGKKFCAFDGEELVPLPLAIGGVDAAGAAGAGAGVFLGGLGKICPSCSRRYESDATFCGRDGAELVSGN